MECHCHYCQIQKVHLESLRQYKIEMRLSMVAKWKLEGMDRDEIFEMWRTLGLDPYPDQPTAVISSMDNAATI